MKTDRLCVILGAGFSANAGIPLASEVNGYFNRDNTENLLNFLSGEWKWVDFASEVDLYNGRIGYEYRVYGYRLNELVSDYIKNNRGFSSYEDFYQYVVELFKTPDNIQHLGDKAFESYIASEDVPADHPEIESLQYIFKTLSTNSINNCLNYLIADSIQLRSSFIDFYANFIQVISQANRTDIITLNQ